MKKPSVEETDDSGVDLKFWHGHQIPFPNCLEVSA